MSGPAVGRRWAGSRVPRTAALLLPGLLVFAAGALLPAVRGFDGLYGQDAFGYAGYAQGPLRTALGAGQLPPWFHWPPGYPLLVLLADAITGWGDAAGRLVSLVAGAALPVLTALLARELLAGAADRRRLAVPLLAGALVAVAGHVWQSSVVGMSDTAAAAAATAAAVAVCRYARGGRLRWLLGAAALAAFAIEIRWVFGLVAPAIALVAWARLSREAREAPGRVVGRVVGRGVVAAVVVALVALPTVLPMLAALAAGTPVPFVADFAAYPWDPTAAFRSTTVTIDGIQQFALPTGAFYLLQPFAPYWFGPAALLAIPGIVATLRAGTLASRALLLLWPAAVLGFLAGGGYQNTRFLLAAAPPLAILAAVGAATAWDAARRPRPDRARVLLIAAIGAWLIGSTVLAARFTDAFIDRQTRDLAAIRELAALVPPDGRVLTIGATPVLDHDGRIETAELYTLDPTAALALIGDGRSAWVLVDRRSIDAQWREANPGRTVAALEAGPGLTEVAERGAWTLYRVGPTG